jgi:hypothetical protein
LRAGSLRRMQVGRRSYCASGIGGPRTADAASFWTAASAAGNHANGRAQIGYNGDASTSGNRHITPRNFQSGADGDCAGKQR